MTYLKAENSSPIQGDMLEQPRSNESKSWVVPTVVIPALLIVLVLARAGYLVAF
jgi:hypothetical protein